MQKQMNINDSTHECNSWHTNIILRSAEVHSHGLTCHDSDVTVAIGQDIIERGLLRQTPDDRRLAERANFLFLLYVEALHLIGQTHHLSSKQKDASNVNKDAAVSLQ